MTKRYDFDTLLAAQETEDRVIVVDGEEYPIGEIPAFVQLRMGAIGSMKEGAVTLEEMETIITGLKSAVPGLAERMETMSMRELNVIIRLIAGAEEFEGIDEGNASTVSEEA